MQITTQTGSKIINLKLNELVPVLKLFTSIKSEAYSPCTNTMYPEFKWKPRKLNNEKLIKNHGIFSWQLLVERCNPLLVIWHGKWKETKVHTGFTTFKTTWTTTKGYLPGNIQKSSSYLSAGQGIPPCRERSAGEFEVVELYKRLLNFNNLSVFRSEMSTSLTVSLFLCHRRFSMSSLEYINSIIVQLTWTLCF